MPIINYLNPFYNKIYKLFFCPGSIHSAIQCLSVFHFCLFWCSSFGQGEPLCPLSYPFFFEELHVAVQVTGPGSSHSFSPIFLSLYSLLYVLVVCVFAWFCCVEVCTCMSRLMIDNRTLCCIALPLYSSRPVLPVKPECASLTSLANQFALIILPQTF